MPTEIVIERIDKTDNGWSGYFKGVRGNYIFFDGDDGYDGGVPFAIYDGTNAQKLFEDSVRGDFQDLRLTQTSIGYEV